MSLSVRLTADMHKRLKDLANRTGRPTSYYVREALDSYMDDLEDVYLADQRMAEIRAGRVVPVSDAEMSRRLGLED